MDLRESTLREQSSLDLLVRQFLITLDDDLVNAHLLFLIHLHIKDHITLLRDVITLGNGNLGILETLIIEISLGQDLRTVNSIRCELTALEQTQLILHILTLTLLQTDIIDVRDTRTHGQVDMQVHMITNQRVGHDRHV